MLLVQQLLGVLQKEQAVCALPLRIRIRKMRADISQARRAQQRVAERVRQHVAVRMPDGTFVKRQLDASDDKLASFRQPVQVVTDARPHSLRLSPRISPAAALHPPHQEKAKSHLKNERRGVQQDQCPIAAAYFLY